MFALIIATTWLYVCWKAADIWGLFAGCLVIFFVAGLTWK